MSDLFEICLLGPLHIHRSTTHIANPTSEKIQALLAWLAVESDKQHRRDLLAELIWPDQPDGIARQNLRQSLSRLQRSLTPNGDVLPWLAITRQTVFVRSGGDLWVDLHHFIRLLNEAAHHRHERIEYCQPCCEKLSQAVELYRGDFLLGLSINSSAFDEWALLKREWLRREVLQALDTLVHFYEAKGDPAAAYRFAWRRVEIDPLLEDAHQQVMRNLAASGRRNEALAQYETLSRLLYDELGVEPASETTALYEAIHDEREIRDSATDNDFASRISYPINLPPQHTPFIGRKAELAQIAERLAHPNCHLLTLVGLGGMGKTRLAIEAAQAQAANFAGGVHFVNLVPINASELLPITIAHATGLKLDEEAENFSQQRAALLTQLQSRNLLLLLDNAEHLLASPNLDPLLDLLVEILQSAPGIKLLVTSRQPLGLQAEWLFDVEGLGLPEVENGEMGRWGDGVKVPLPTLPPINADAAQLFIHSAQRILPNFAAEKERSSLVEICQRTEGLALGIELAAAWVRQFSCAEIAQRIKASYDFLATTMRDVPERHRSLRAVFESSWALLTDAEKRVYLQLAIFRGSFNLTAITAIASATVADVTTLTERSLVRVEKREREEVRFSLHEALRQFAMEKLAENVSSFTQSQQRHAKYYLTLLWQEEAALDGDAIHEAIARVHREIDNLRAAWQTAVERSDVESIARSYYAFMRYFVLTHQVEEGINALGAAAESIHQHLDTQPLTDPQLTQSLAESLAEIIAYRGRLFYKLARYDEAIAHCSETLRLAEPIGAARPAALANLYIGITLVNLGELETARTKFAQSQIHAQRAGWRKVEGDAIRGLGIVHEYGKEFAQATAYYEASAEICREINDVRGLSASIGNLGSICRQEGDFERAHQLFEEALSIHRQIGDRSSEGRSLSNLGELSADLEEYERAEKYFSAALSVQRSIKEPQHEADTLTSLGELYARTERVDQAISNWQQALAIYEKIGETPNRDRVVAYLQSYRLSQD